MFKKKIVSGQVCYETEIKIQKLRYLGVDWNSLLQRTFSEKKCKKKKEKSLLGRTFQTG